MATHRKMIRRWNQLSRLQRSLVYAVIIIAITVIVLVYSSNNQSNEDAKEARASKLIQKLTKNTSLIHEPVKNKQLKKSAEENKKDESEFELPTFSGPANNRQQAVVSSFQHAWKGYKEYAWGYDNLKPVSKGASNWFSLGLTIVDALDTAFIMGLSDEYEEGKQWVEDNLHFTRNKDVNFFEVTIRVLGALLTNYHFTQDKMFLAKAVSVLKLCNCVRTGRV